MAVIHVPYDSYDLMACEVVSTNTQPSRAEYYIPKCWSTSHYVDLFTCTCCFGVSDTTSDFSKQEVDMIERVQSRVSGTSSMTLVPIVDDGAGTSAQPNFGTIM